jgi:ABC-type nitrate/sulfonate/bicarbonate transport system ATPase subunit
MQQKDLLLPWRSVLDNAALGPLTQGQGKQASRAKALEGLQLFGLQDKAWSYPHQLSGGMRQRVALLRTLLCRKSIILLDEPFGALDAITRVKMHRQLLAVWNLLQASIILVTHDVDEALSLADSLLLLSASPARVLASRDIDLPRPRQTTDPGFVACKRYVLEQLTTRDRP